ncbi:MAG: hypothetical protein J5927_07170 [Oscillospiraceae bacterium]|nr:hypothetical protein [Oscillospiraceae bacterium]
MKQLCENLFRFVVVGFSLLLLVLSLLHTAQTAAANESVAALEQEVASLRKEEARLRADWESSVCLEEIEGYATEKLGLQHRSPGQIVYLQLPEENEE